MSNRRTPLQPVLAVLARAARIAWPHWISVRHLAVRLGLVVAVLGAAGAVVSADVVSGPRLDLNSEWALPAAFAAGLLLATGGLALYVAGDRRATARSAWRTYGVLLIGMGLDEGLMIHERLEEAVGIDWQLLYAPLILAAGVVWTMVLASRRSDVAFARLMLAGAACWVASQALEWVQFQALDSEGPGDYVHLMVIEEVLEMAGSALLVLAAYRVALERRRREARVVASGIDVPVEDSPPPTPMASVRE